MNNEIILTALQSQLDAKNAELQTQLTEVAGPAKAEFTQKVLERLRESVYEFIPGIDIGTGRLEILKTNSSRNGWSALTVSLENDWRSEDRSLFAKMNWYGSSATVKDENELNDVRVFGAVANRLAWIEYVYINEWRPAIQEIEAPIDAIQSEIFAIERSIRDVQSKIKDEAINEYKKVGFKLTLTKALKMVNNYDKPDYPVELSEFQHAIQISTGRSKWDYVYAPNFKVIMTNKYKTTIEIEHENDQIRQYTVSANAFNGFIESVYYWETVEAKRHNDSITERYNKHYSKQ